MPTTPTTLAASLAQRPALNLLLALALLVAGPVAAWAQVQPPAPALSTPATPAPAAPGMAAPAPSAFDPLVPPAPGMAAPATGEPVHSPAGDAAAAPAAPAADPSATAPATGEAPADPAASGLPLDQGEDPSVAAQLPHDLSPWGMFLAADWVVKAVMIGLAFASVVTWTVWLAKTLELAVAKRRLRRALKGYLASATLDEARRVDPRGPAGAMLATTDLELQRSGPLPADGIKERVSISLSRIEVAAGRAITRGTGLLATIGATAPFVGLFGTVWGIMNSFIGIS
ncbi:MotA/TolQ/ExbB proton channel family protein, partial [Ancylobacter vacuolatus]